MKKHKPLNVLVVRFSSIGDIVLTTPVVRCLKKQLPENSRIDYLTKWNFIHLLAPNPYIDSVIGFEKSINEVMPLLIQAKYDVIIDLHNNLRSNILKARLFKRNYSFNKLNIKKWFYINFKINKLPKKHIVERYLDTIKPLGITPDSDGLDYFFQEENQGQILKRFNLVQKEFIGLVLGAAHFTKRIPFEKLCEIIEQTSETIVLLGGPAEKELGEQLLTKFPNKVIQTCGELSLDESAQVVQTSKLLITSDTGLMHIGAALEIPMVVFWGNTTPSLGMYPYGRGKFVNMEVAGLDCRPCSKIGFQECPKQHFNCMVQQNVEVMKKKINVLLNQ